MANPDLVVRLGKICSRVDFDLENADPLVLERLHVLDRNSPVVADAERMAELAFAVFHHYEQHKPDQAFDAEERRVVVLGCMFSDIGKTGPLAADASGRELIAQMFSVEGVENDAQTAKAFCRTYFPEDAEERLWKLEQLDLDPEMSIRTFWNLHSRWTLELLEAGHFPPEVVAAAATHHLLEGINPDSIVGEDRRFSLPFGNNERFDRAEKLVIVLDKYDAARRRGHLSHDRAVEWLRERVQAHPEFHSDAELATLIDDIAAIEPS